MEGTDEWMLSSRCTRIDSKGNKKKKSELSHNRRPPGVQFGVKHPCREARSGECRMLGLEQLCFAQCARKKIIVVVVLQRRPLL